MRPRFSIVTAVYNVEPYLEDYIASIEAQTFDFRQLQVIVVDDGSTDGSLSLLEAWTARRPELVTVFAQPNGGPGSARNLGLEHASGEWVTFTDPDDMLDPDFFKAIDRFIAAHPQVDVVAPRLLQLNERRSLLRDDHPRAWQFLRGARVVDLQREPNVFPSTGTVSLYRMDRIREASLRFDVRVRPNFEDGHFAATYLLLADQPPRVGLVPKAKYVYRRRLSRDSAMQLSKKDPRRFTDVLEFGLLGLLDQARARDGSIPAWVQQLVIYEVTRYLSADETISAAIQVPVELEPAFHDLLCRVISQLDPKVVRAHHAREMKSVWADILSHGCRPTPWHSRVAARTKVDLKAGLQRVAYRYTGPTPREEFLVDGIAVEAAYSKLMSHRYYGRTMLWERIVWLPNGALQVRLDGVVVSIVPRWSRPASLVRPKSLSGWVTLLRSTPTRRLFDAAVTRMLRRGYRLASTPVRLIARLPPYRATFRDAWVVMDRIYNADDNGERLFEHLLAERPDINAWFVIEKGTQDWERLKASGQRRLVAHGSWTWIVLMLNCAWVVSSHAPRAVAAPPKVTRMLPGPTWRFAFLQHGVTKDDLSKWLNKRDMDLLVVSTVPELESVVADGTGYRYTAREARNTGLPRFDRLLAKGREVAPANRDLILIAPTWRMWLTDTPDVHTHRRIVDDAFWTSDYLRCWLGVLRSPEIAAAAAGHGLRIAFMPHPNMQVMLRSSFRSMSSRSPSSATTSRRSMPAARCS
jgi:glycosyltransferase involved in cell wall biosynthesis